MGYTVNKNQRIDDRDYERFPSGWWILPGIVVGILLYGGLFYAGRATAPEGPRVAKCEVIQVAPSGVRL